jgi:hypothetical protein
MFVSLDTESILIRIKSLRAVSKDKDIAMLLELSPQDFSNRKKRDTLIEPIVKWGINENVDLNWLLTGEEFSNPKDGPTPLDPVILKQVIEGVESYLEDIKKVLSPELKARLISLLYDYFAKTGEQVHRRKVESYLKLVA